jgi:signal recognition particle GTPase
MTAEEKAVPTAQLSAAQRSRIAQAAGCSVGEVGEALGKFEFTKAATARMAQLRAEGKPMPTSWEDLEVCILRWIPRSACFFGDIASECG